MIFLIAAPRSGSTMLEHILSSHSMIQGGPEPHLLTPLAHVGYYASVEAAPYDPVKAAEGLKAFVAALGDGEDSYRLACRAYCDLLYGRYLSQGEKPICLDKTPAYALIRPFLTEVFPDARYVVLTRHPLALFSSYANSFFDGDYARAQGYNPVLNRYVPALAAFVRQDRVPYVHVRYEDLVHDPDTWMRTIFEYLGVPFEQDAIDYGAHGGQRPVKGLGDPLGVNRHTRPTTASVAKWVQDLAGDPEREALMRGIVGQLEADDLRTIGYPPETLWAHLEHHRASASPKAPERISRYRLQRKAIVTLRAAAQRNGPLRRALTAARKLCDGLLG